MIAADDLIAGADAPIVVADRARVRFIVLNRPAARNALTRAMRADFSGVLAAADADDGVDAVVLTGAGGCFSAGVDLRALAKPVIAAIDGPCITGALEMALSCSFAIATPAALFADTHCKVGLFPAWGGGALLTSAIGVRRARQMMLTGAMIDAPTAVAWGLVNELVAAADLLPRAAALAAAIADQARRQPRTFALHAAMLDAIDAAGTEAAAGIERAMRDRFLHDTVPVPHKGTQP